MNEFERQLRDGLQRRADATIVTVALDAVRSAASSGTTRPAATRTPLVLGAAALALVVAGLVVVSSTRGDSGTAAPATSTSDPLDALPSGGPTIDDHWHIAYGIDVCGEWYQLSGSLEELDANGQPVNADYAATGIHSHDDGLIHLHPYGPAGSGDNATLGLVFDNYGVELSDDGLSFGATSEQTSLAAAYRQCINRADDVVVTVWPDLDRPDERVVIGEHLADVPLGADRMAITISVGGDGSTVGLPPSAADFDEITNPSVDEMPTAPTATTHHP